MKEIQGLFSPIGNKDIRSLYPELKKVKEFTDISYLEFSFVWHYVFANGADNNERRRIAQSIIDSFGTKMPIETQEQYKNGNIPDKVRLAINILKTYDLSARLKARFITEKTLNNYFTIANTDISTITEKDDLKKHLDIQKDALKALPDIIASLEGNFGVSDQAFEEYSEMQGSILDEFHNENKN